MNNKIPELEIGVQPKNQESKAAKHTLEVLILSWLGNHRLSFSILPLYIHSSAGIKDIWIPSIGI